MFLATGLNYVYFSVVLLHWFSVFVILFSILFTMDYNSWLNGINSLYSFHWIYFYIAQLWHIKHRYHSRFLGIFRSSYLLHCFTYARCVALTMKVRSIFGICLFIRMIKHCADDSEDCSIFGWFFAPFWAKNRHTSCSLIRLCFS